LASKFKDFKYERPDIKRLKIEFELLFKEFRESDSAESQIGVINRINIKRRHFSTMSNLASIRYREDTNNKFYDDEETFFDSNGPVFGSLTNEFNKLLLGSAYRSELEERFGKHLFTLIELRLKAFSDEIIEDLKKENALISEYVKLTASAKIPFEGEDRNIEGMSYFMESANREVRKNAYAAKYKFFEENEKEFDRIYDELVKLRTKMARKLGYRDYADMAYDTLSRSEYNRKDVAGFRNSVEKYIVPVTEKIKEAQKKRLGYDDIRYYDQNFMFNSGNAFPKGDPEWITQKAAIMYSELSPDTKEFFDFMTDRELLDLDNRNGKAGGGFCSFLPDHKSPFIFSNMNRTAHDVTVFTHEAGHAFQVYESRNFDIPEYVSPTFEACEIHSMSMEFITWPWMNLFFEEDTDKLFYIHLTGRLLFIPYGAAVDEFQHRVYENPDMTPDERKKVWREIEKKYTPYKNYADNDFLERGCWWMQQRHIFAKPFYYIDYCLAQICAFQFWEKCNHDRDIAWEDYLRLCKSGGSKPFLELLKIAKLKSPFESKTVQYITEYCDDWVNRMDKDF
jgi:M3 family oligoendopeptidase